MSLDLAIAIVGLTSLALALLLVPLLSRADRAPSRDAYNLTVYRDQLAEIERDLARGLLNPEQAEAARTEIGRRILALHDGGTDMIGANRQPLIAAVLAVLVLPVAALALYAQLGSPSLPDRPFTERTHPAGKTTDSAGHLDMQEALAKLRAHLEQRPDDLTGWLLLARSEFGLAHFAEAVTAYRRADELSGHRPDISGDWGEAQVMAAGGTVTAEAHKAFETALKDPEAAPRSRYYLALARLQHGDAKGALDDWVALDAESPDNAEWLPLLHQRITEAAGAAGVPVPPRQHASKPEAGGMPSREAVAAAARSMAGASDKDRQAMIKAMVERLAARLEQHPDDADGWARLGGAYMVLHNPAKARDAYAHAVKLRPDDAALQQSLNEASVAVTRAAPSP